MLVFAGALSGFEWLRGHVLTGFPWDLPGETWRAGSPVSQTAALVGAYGLTFVTLAGAACLFVAAEGQRGARLAIAALPVSFALLYVAAGNFYAILGFTLLMGASQGVITIVRGALPLALFGAAGYGAVLGIIAALTVYRGGEAVQSREAVTA